MSKITEYYMNEAVASYYDYLDDLADQKLAGMGISSFNYPEADKVDGFDRDDLGESPDY